MPRKKKSRKNSMLIKCTKRREETNQGAGSYRLALVDLLALGNLDVLDDKTRWEGALLASL
jgi:hypothetical protein